jgi:hypothetical protein
MLRSRFSQLAGLVAISVFLAWPIPATNACSNTVFPMDAACQSCSESRNVVGLCQDISINGLQGCLSFMVIDTNFCECDLLLGFPGGNPVCTQKCACGSGDPEPPFFSKQEPG